MMRISASILLGSLFLTACSSQSNSQTRNGFDVSNASIPVEEIMSGGPPRDGIPSIDDPKFMEVEAVAFLEPDDLVAGLVINGQARAYPLRILVWHEIVNDRIAGKEIAVTYCPLCGTVMTFDRRVGDDILTFGVSGLLYHSDVLMFDRESESLWSQLAMEAVSGPRVGETLELLPTQLVTWEAWRREHPQSLVLSPDTGFFRSYGKSPYAGYEETERVMFPVPQTRTELSNKAWIAGVVLDGESKAWALEDLATADGPVEGQLAGRELAVFFDPDTRHMRIEDSATGEEIPHIPAYWFAWQAFYPDTRLWGHDE